MPGLLILVTCWMSGNAMVKVRTPRGPEESRQAHQDRHQAIVDAEMQSHPYTGDCPPGVC